MALTLILKELGKAEHWDELARALQDLANERRSTTVSLFYILLLLFFLRCIKKPSVEATLEKKAKFANKTRSFCKKKAETSNGVIPFNEDR